jgi:uncharacterized protein
MIIDIDRLTEEGFEVIKEFEFLMEDLIEENAVFLKPLLVNISIKKIGEEIYLKGRIATLLSLICSRCLSPYEFQVNSIFDHVYLPEELEVTSDQLDDEEMNRMYYISRRIDLDEIILEQLNFTFPPRPLCSEDCQGICPICGHIVSEGNCTCATSEADARLEKFKIFLRDK